MKESYCIVDKRVTPSRSQVATKKIKEDELNSTANVRFAELKKLDM